MKYRATFAKKLNDAAFATPTDFLHFSERVKQTLVDMTIAKNTSRSETWVYEFEDADGLFETDETWSNAIERTFDSCQPLIRYSKLAEREYWIVSTYGSGWFIVSGPFSIRPTVSGPTSTDIYPVTASRNARVVTWNQMSRLRTGVPARRIGDEGRWQMFEEYRQRLELERQA